MSDAAGRIQGGAHVMPVRVYWEDTDAFGIVYYANYLRFIERARSDLLRAMQIDQVRLFEDEDRAFAVRRCAVDYAAPARLGDLLQVTTTVTDLRGATIAMRQEVARGGASVASCEVLLACLDRAGRPRRVPAQVHRALATLSPNLNGKSAA